ncbi:MAG: hypothetical protein IT382_24490 [Deltaproteobacteria bacterium]|nr:hypothetical protein [Deltaproteobacteria bacterium]
MSSHPTSDRRAPEVQYRIVGEDGEPWTLSTADRARGALPVWTELSCHKCPSCPLDERQQAHCPAAVAIAPVADAAGHRRSTEKVEVRVQAGGRTVLKHTDLQDALRSFIGLVMSTSGCPALARLRPLARHHLPFATPEETLWRVAGSFAVDAFQRGLSRADWWGELRALYEQLGVVNRVFCQRLKERLPGDAGVNAIVNLFSLSVCVKDELEDEVTALAMLLGASTPAQGVPAPGPAAAWEPR